MDYSQPIVVNYRKKPIYMALKRIVDFMGALIAIILLSWLFWSKLFC